MYYYYYHVCQEFLSFILSFKIQILSNKSSSLDQRYLTEHPGPQSLELRASYSGSEQKEKCPLTV